MLLAAGGGSVIVTTVLSALSAAADSYGAAAVSVSVRAAAATLAIALNVTLFMVAFKILIATPVSVRQIRAGAIAAAVIWQALQLAGAVLLGDKLKGATATYGLFAIVLSLLAPFSDTPDLTVGDQRAYISYAKTELHKSFETIDVSFSPPPSGPQERE